MVKHLGAALAGDGRDRGPADQVVAEITEVADFTQATAMGSPLRAPKVPSYG